LTKRHTDITRRWFYGFGAIAYGIKDNGFSFFLLFYYQQILGLPGTLAGLAILIAMFFDALSDPLVGIWSDNTRTRWGRRHPFMYASALPAALAYFLIWNPPEVGTFGLFLYMTLTAILIRFCITLYEIPSSAIVAELTDDYDERTSLLSYRYMMGWYGGLTMALVNWGILIVAHGQTRTAYGLYGTIGSTAIFAAIMISSIGLHRYIPHLKKPAHQATRGLLRILADTRQTLANRNFAALFFAGLFASTGAGVAASFDVYIVNHFWEFTASQWRWVIASLYISACLPLVFAPFITGRWDKKRSILCVYAFQITFAALPFILRLAGWFPDNDNPWTYYLIWGHTIINVTMIVMFGIIQSSMLADVVEHSQMSTDRREEGLFFASRSLAQKATQGIGVMLAGVALDIIDFPRSAVPGEVPDETIWQLGFIYGPLLMSLYMLAFLSISFYRISRQGHERRVETLRIKR